MIHTLSKIFWLRFDLTRAPSHNTSYSGLFALSQIFTAAGLLPTFTEFPYRDVLNIDYFLTFVNKKMKIMKKFLKQQNFAGYFSTLPLSYQGNLVQIKGSPATVTVNASAKVNAKAKAGKPAGW